MKATFVALVCGGVFAAAGAGAATPATVVAVNMRFEPGGTFASQPVITQGEELLFANADLLNGEYGAHTLTATTTDPATRQPWFDTGHVAAGDVGPVRNVAGLKPGIYPFVCAYHPFMAGVLTVTQP